MEISKNLKLAQSVTTNSPIFAGIVTGSITGNAATVTTNANLTGMVTSVGNATTVVTNANLTGVVTSVGNATTFANDPLFINGVSISTAGLDKTSLTISSTSTVDTGTVRGLSVTMTEDNSVGIYADASNTNSIGAEINGDIGAIISGFTQGLQVYGFAGMAVEGSNDVGLTVNGYYQGINVFSSGIDATGVYVESPEGDGVYANCLGIGFSATINGGGTGVYVTCNGTGSIGLTIKSGAGILSGTGIDCESYTVGAIISNKGGGQDLTGFPAAHARFGDTAATSLSIRRSDGSLYWRLGSSGTQTLTLARSATITGQQTATLPDTTGTIKVANTKTSTATATSTSSTFFASVAGMSYAATDLIAGATYKLEVVGQVTHGAGFYKLQALLSSAKTFAIGDYTNTAIASVKVATGTGTTIDLGTVAAGSVVNQPVYAMAIIRVALATTLNIQFAQSVSNATASTFLIGAVSTLTRIS